MKSLHRPTSSTLRHWPVLFSVTILLACISSESLWIDEVTTAWISAQPDFGGFVDALLSGGSEAQMPLFCIYSWCWARLFGISEVALRCSNIPWAIVGVISTLWLLARTGCRKHAVLLLALPILCFYMNEARPYIMTFATATLCLAALDSLVADSCAGHPARRPVRFLFLAGLLLCVGSSMLAFFIIPAMAVYALVMILTCGKERAAGPWSTCLFLLKSNLGTIVLACAGILAFAAYYGLTLALGHGGQESPFVITNAAFAVYEWLGFGGLSAPRNILRELGPHTAFRQYWPSIVPGLAVWALVAILAIRRARQVARDRLLWRSFAGLATGAGLLVLAAIVAPASLWGRHFMFLAPFYLVILGRLLAPEIGLGAHTRAVVFTALLIVFLLSSARQRCLPAYQKDPYRAAVTELRAYSAKYPDLPMVWISYGRAVDYYGGRSVPPDDQYAAKEDRRAPAVLCLGGWPADKVERWHNTHADYILVMHRPDKCDLAGHWSRIAASKDSVLLWNVGNIRIYRVSHET